MFNQLVGNARIDSSPSWKTWNNCELYQWLYNGGNICSAVKAVITPVNKTNIDPYADINNPPIKKYKHTVFIPSLAELDLNFINFNNFKLGVGKENIEKYLGLEALKSQSSSGDLTEFLKELLNGKNTATRDRGGSGNGQWGIGANGKRSGVSTVDNYPYLPCFCF